MGTRPPPRRNGQQPVREVGKYMSVSKGALGCGWQHSQTTHKKARMQRARIRTMQCDIPLQHSTHLVGRDLSALDRGDSFDNSRRHFLAHGGLRNTT